MASRTATDGFRSVGKASRNKRERREQPALYHYTSAVHLPLIVRTGVLRTTESNVSLFKEHAAPDVVWLTTDPVAEADHGLVGSAVDKRAVRIRVRAPEAVRWTEWVKQHPMVPEGWRQSFVARAGGPEVAATWWVSEKPIPRADWLEISTR